MFGKKKTFAPGTFIPTKTRVFLILHMSLAFTLLTWCGFIPFMGEYFARQSQTLLVGTVKGNLNLAQHLSLDEKVDAEAKLIRNQERFRNLPVETTDKLDLYLNSLGSKATIPFSQKFRNSMQIIVFDMPLFAQAWILFSIIISIFLLLRIEGSQQVVWILPLLVVLYSISNYYYGEELEKSPDHVLFPTEKILVEQYMNEPLSDHILEQQKQLMQGWKNYLVREWVGEEPSKELEVYDLQVENGEFAFNLARIEKFQESSLIDSKSPLRKRESPYLLFSYFGWNLFLALYVNRRNALA